MAKTINQKIIFRNTSVAILYDLYVNEKKHAMVTGEPASIMAKEGSSFMAHDGYIKGKNLQLIKNRLIVQSWRGSDWEKDDIDSTFIILLEQKVNHVILYVTHANLPDKHAAGIDKGWYEYYWEPWKMHLRKK